jgi:hypothetical protein
VKPAERDEAEQVEARVGNGHREGGDRGQRGPSGWIGPGQPKKV